ncbi:F-box/LRR-repeat protein At4g14103-like [Carex rostrata]
MMNIKARGSEENYGIDKISSLPDDVRTHILSFLTTKEVVQTCILSKRWINTWASVPDLKFNIEEFGLPEIVYAKIAVEFVTKFELLLRSVLEKREISCVNKFQLLFDSDFCLPLTQAFADCIGDVMKLNPRECLVNVGPSTNLKLNANLIFTCASLIHLQLRFCIKVDLELNSVYLPCLKTLNLNSVATSDNFLKKLLLGCPVLEELVLEFSFLNMIEICSNTLKKFVLHRCYGMGIQISTPNLLYLDIDVDRWDILLLNLPSLVHASIFFRGWYDQDEYDPRGPKLIQSLSIVESLLFYPMGKVRKMDFSYCPVFDNLKSLVLVDSVFCVFDLAPFFIHQSPKLQEVTLENYDDDDVISLSLFVLLPELESDTEFVDEEITQEGHEYALVQREFLKAVRIVGFKNNNEFVNQLINKLLLHVKIIGEIHIV